MAAVWSNEPGAVDPIPISAKFEEAIRVNAARGYTLKDWKLVSVAHPSQAGTHYIITETIVAVFAKEWRP